jgi:hypothetical protein
MEELRNLDSRYTAEWIKNKNQENRKEEAKLLIDREGNFFYTSRMHVSTYNSFVTLHICAS